MDKNVEEFKVVCRTFLSRFSIRKLRVYGRYIDLREPTKLNKEDLVEEIVVVLSGEKTSQRSKRGAPVKNNEVDPRILETVEQLKSRILYREQSADIPTIRDRLQAFAKENKENTLLFQDSGAEKSAVSSQPTSTMHVYDNILRGQLEICGGVACLLHENGRLQGDKIYVPVELLRRYDLREGDIVTCYGKRTENMMSATHILTINGIMVDSIEGKRPMFDSSEVCEPHEPLAFINPREEACVAVKYVDWLLPMYKGQRGCIRSVPKAGKTSLLFDLAKAAHRQKNFTLFVLLLDQSPETVTRFKKALPHAQLLYTTYEADCDEQVYTAEFLLKRAKRFVESGHNVVLLVDSLNALANAYNETDFSSGGKVLAGGLESKTVHYLKKYFGTARCLENGNSLTILGTFVENTGNPADDVITAETCALANYQICLSDTLANNRVFPAIEYKTSRTSVLAKEKTGKALESFMCKKFPHGQGEEKLIECLQMASTDTQLLAAIHDIKNWN